MSAPAVARNAVPAPSWPVSFADWRARLRARGVPPVVAVAGSRGKTTVARLLDAVFASAGLRTALWTDTGVEVSNRRQRGELAPWSRALARLSEGTLDVAIQELDWATVHAVGLPPAAYPVVAVTNLCANSDSCLVQDETRRAVGALRRVRHAVRGDGVLVLNGEDYAVSGEETEVAPAVLVALSRETPLVRGHLDAGGAAAWTEDDRLFVGTAEVVIPIARLPELRLASGGTLGFQVHNALTAAALARACGIGLAEIESALRDFTPPPRLMPGSFNLVRIGSALVIVDRPAPSWFLRPALRAIARLPWRRLLTVVGRLDGVPESDLAETGRLLGRFGGALILHDQADTPERAALLRQGIAANDVPPVILQVETERQAVARALEMLGPDDLAFVLADQPAPVLRALQRSQSRGAA